MYGQGMTMAALGATVLREVAASADGRIDGLAAAAQTAIARWVDIAFANAVRLDSAYAGSELVNLERPPRHPEVEQALTGLATEDAEIAIEVRRAILTMDSSPIQRESIQRKIAAWIRTGRTVSPSATDPRALPALVDADARA
jgi:hypothetical protein